MEHDVEFDKWLDWYRSPKVRHRQKYLAKLPNWTIFFLYNITQPIMHPKKSQGYCKLQLLCEEHSYRLYKIGK